MNTHDESGTPPRDGASPPNTPEPFTIKNEASPTNRSFRYAPGYGSSTSSTPAHQLAAENPFDSLWKDYHDALRKRALERVEKNKNKK